jgi:hypothetical protein
MTLNGQLRPVFIDILPALFTQPANDGLLSHPHWERWYRQMATRPVLSPGQIPGAGAQVTLAPGMSDEHFGDEFTAYADDRIRANGSRPGRVS